MINNKGKLSIIFGSRWFHTRNIFSIYKIEAVPVPSIVNHIHILYIYMPVEMTGLKGNSTPNLWTYLQLIKFNLQISESFNKTGQEIKKLLTTLSMLACDPIWLPRWLKIVAHCGLTPLVQCPILFEWVMFNSFHIKFRKLHLCNYEKNLFRLNFVHKRNELLNLT